MTDLLPNESIVSLTNLKGGAAIELFDTELKKVLDNIADPNTKAKFKREIVLKVTILPEDDRSQALVGIDVKSKLVDHKGAATRVYFGLTEGRRIAVESGPGPGLFDDPKKLKTVPVKKQEVTNND